MISILVASAVFSASNSVARLPTVIVEGTRPEKPHAVLPFGADVISSEEIASSAARDLPSLLARVPGVDVTNPGGGNPVLAQVTMRGYGENGFGRVLMLVDGERLANPDLSAPNLARIPLSGIGRIEVLHGPQSVLHGDGASAGMIDIITDGDETGRRSYAETSVGSDGRCSVASGSRGAADEKESVYYFADGAFTRGDGWRENSDYRVYNAQGGLRKKFENGSFLRFSAFFNDSDFSLPGPLSRETAGRSPRKSLYSDHGRTSSYGFNFTGNIVANDENEIKSVFTFSHRRSDFDNGDYTDIYGVENLYRRDYGSDLYTVQLKEQYVSKTAIDGFDNEFTAGCDIRYDALDAVAVDEYPAWNFRERVRHDIGRLSAGLFAHDRFYITENLSVTAGARVERDRNSNNLVSRANNDTVASYDASARYSFSDEKKIFLRWCRFFRRPFIDEYRWRDAAREETASPERGWNVELGFTCDFAEDFTTTFVAYWSETQNEIMYDPYLMSNENAPWTNRRRGVDFSIGWEREKTAELFFSACAVFSEAADGKYKGNEIPAVPAVKASVDGRVYITDSFDVFGGCAFRSRRYAISDFANMNGALSSASVFRSGLRYKPEKGLLEGFSFTFSVENVFDERYCDYAVASVVTGENAYYPAEGRTFLFTARYDF